MRTKKILKILLLNLKDLKIINVFAIIVFLMLFILNSSKVINFKTNKKKIRKILCNIL